MEISNKNEGKKLLRILELKAYRGVVNALRAQGVLTSDKHEVLKNLATTLKVGEERHRSEMKRAVNDDLLAFVAQSTISNDNDKTWQTESMRRVPSASMLPPQTVFTSFADNISDIVAAYAEKFDENSTSLNLFDSARSCVALNSVRYHTNKIFEPLLVNKRFRDREILEELQKIKSSNRYSNPSEYLQKLIEPPDISQHCYVKDCAQSSMLSNEQLDSVVLARMFYDTNQPLFQTNGTENTVSCMSTDYCNGLIDDLSKSVDATRPKSESLPMLRKAKLNAKRWNPKTQTLETPSPERLALIESNARCIANARDRNLVSISKPVGKLCSAVRAKKPKSHNEIHNAGEISSTKRGRRFVRRYWGRRPNRRTLKKEAEERKPHDTDEYETDSTIDNDPDKESENNYENDLIELADVIEIKSNNDIVRNKKSSVSNFEINLTDNEGESCKSSKSTIELSQDNSTCTSNSRSRDVVSPTNSVVIPSQENDAKLHTFNLIPASRRIKMLKKRGFSQSYDVESPAKKSCNCSITVPIRTSPASVESNSMVDLQNAGSTCKMELKNMKKDVNISTNSLDVAASSSQNNTYTPIRRIKTLLPGSGDVVTKLSLLGSVRVRNINPRSSLLLEKVANSTENSLVTHKPWSGSATDKLDKSSKDCFDIAAKVPSHEEGVSSSDLLGGNTSYENGWEETPEQSLEAVWSSGGESPIAIPPLLIGDIAVDSVARTTNVIMGIGNSEKLIDIEAADVVIDNEGIVQTLKPDAVCVEVTAGGKLKMDDFCGETRTYETLNIMEPLTVENGKEEVLRIKETISSIALEDDWKEVHPGSVEILNDIFNKQQDDEKKGVIPNMEENFSQLIPDISATKPLYESRKEAIEDSSYQSSAHAKADSEKISATPHLLSHFTTMNNWKNIRVRITSNSFDKDVENENVVDSKNVSESLRNVTRILGPTGRITTIQKSIPAPLKTRSEIGVVEKETKVTDVTNVTSKKSKRTRVLFVKLSKDDVSGKCEVENCTKLKSLKSSFKKTDSSKQNILLPPVSKRVYDLYNDPKKREMNRYSKKVINAIDAPLPSTTLTTTSLTKKECVIKPESLIEISSISENNVMELSDSQQIVEIYESEFEKSMIHFTLTLKDFVFKEVKGRSVDLDSVF